MLNFYNLYYHFPVTVWTTDADDVNPLRNNTDTIKKNTATLTDASKKVGLEVNAEKTYMFLSRYQNAGQNQDS
jgi:hypothetical protein